MIFVLAFALLIIGVPVAWEFKESPDANAIKETVEEVDQVVVVPIRSSVQVLRARVEGLKRMAELWPLVAMVLQVIEAIKNFFK